MAGAAWVNSGLAATLGRKSHTVMLCLAAMATVQAAAQAQTPAAAPISAAGDAPGPIGGPAAQLPGGVTLPTVDQVHLPLPRQVRAATAAMGMGRQRLALVVGIGTVGNQRVVDSAARDSQAVAAALRSAGFVVMLREDINAADLRASLAEFRDRLQPGGVGFIYATGLGAQVQGQNLLLPREAVLDATAPPDVLAAQLRAIGVPVVELVNALVGPADSPRLLVLDAAYKQAALAHLPATGLVEQRLPPGLMALFGHDLGAVKEVPAVAPLPIPAPTDPREMAASAFAGALVKALGTTRINGPDALRATRRDLVNGSMGQTNPWLSGDTETREELAEATLLDAVPHTPEELAREGLRQMTRLATRPAAQAGEQSVASVLQQSASATAPAPASAGSANANLARNAVAGEPGVGSAAATETASAAPSAAPTQAQTQAQTASPPPAAPTTASPAATPATPVQAAGPESIGTQTAANAPINTGAANGAAASGASSVSGALGTAASVAGTALSTAGTVVGIAGSVAAATVAVRAAEASAAVSIAGTAISTAGSLAGSAVTMAARAMSSSGGSDQPARVAQGVAAQAAAVPMAGTASPALAAGAARPGAAALSATSATSTTSTTSTTSAAARSAVAPDLAGVAVQQTANLAPQPSGISARPGNATDATRANNPASTPDTPGTADTSNATATDAAQRLAGIARATAQASPASPVSPISPSMPVTGAAASGSTAGTDLPVAAINASATTASTAAGATRPGIPAQRLPDVRTARNATGGERPAYVPRTNPFGHAEGDTFTYRVTDTWKGQVSSEYTMALEEVRHDGQLLANGQQIVMDPQGRLIRNAAADGSSSEFEPFQDLWWANPTRGQQHDVQFTEFFQRADHVRGQTEWTGSTSVGRPRQIDTPAGSFDVLPLESSGWWTQTLASGVRETGKWSRTVWYAPKLGQPVQIDIEDADRLGKLLKRERVELLHAQSSRSTAATAAATAP